LSAARAYASPARLLPPEVRIGRRRDCLSAPDPAVILNTPIAACGGFLASTPRQDPDYRETSDGKLQGDAVLLLVDLNATAALVGPVSHDPALVMTPGVISFVAALAVVRPHDHRARDWTVPVTMAAGRCRKPDGLPGDAGSATACEQGPATALAATRNISSFPDHSPMRVRATRLRRRHGR
jgi:hypothetical protein